MSEWLMENGQVLLSLVWDIAVTAGVPIAVAYVAARYVVQQLAQTEKHRKEQRDERLADRQAEAIVELSQMMIADADTMVRVIDQSIENLRALKAGKPAPAAARITQLDRFRNNSYYVRAQALLAANTPAVANWVLEQSERIYAEGIKVLAETGDPGVVSGPARHLVMNIATETTKKLFAWQRGDVSDQWFIDQLTNG
ncbi:hypothetical protein [Microbacterium sp. NPDC055599]